jgi:predicted HTH transcriptional regulator
MEKQTLIQLTIDLYRLTLLFPKKEPLRFKIRELANEVLEGVLRMGDKDEYAKRSDLEVIHNLEVLESFFAVAKEQNWVSQDELLKVSLRYDNLRQELEDSGKQNTILLIPEPPVEKTKDFDNAHKNLQRQDKILGVLKEKGQAQVWELKMIFPEVSKRTLRRDFEYLFGRGLVERVGERNQTFYRLKESMV